MEVLYPKKLKKGDRVMVIAPARSFKLLSDDTIQRAVERLEALGLHVVFGKHVDECDEFLTSTVQSRVDDLHSAFADDSISGIFSVVGGYSTNQMLDYIDYDFIRSHPKILCGFSDITILHNAILEKSGVAGYYGPHFSSRGIKYGFEYSIEYFKKCCMDPEPFTISPSGEWSDDERYLDQEKRTFENNEGFVVLNEGSCTGRIRGGNLECICVLMGTPYLPKIDEDILLFIEQDAEGNPQRFDRWLEQIYHADFSKHIKGIIIGRFQKNNTVSTEQLRKIISSNKKIQNIPIVMNANFGHVMPIATFPIGGMGSIEAYRDKVQLSILEH